MRPLLESLDNDSVSRKCLCMYHLPSLMSNNKTKRINIRDCQGAALCHIGHMLLNIEKHMCTFHCVQPCIVLCDEQTCDIATASSLIAEDPAKAFSHLPNRGQPGLVPCWGHVSWAATRIYERWLNRRNPTKKRKL